MTEHQVIDTSEKSRSYLWVCANGSYLKLSPSAYHLLKTVEAGASFESIATMLSERQGKAVTPDDVKAAHRRITDRINAVESRDARAVSGFWIRIPFIPGRVVAKLARVLALAFNPSVAACLCLVTLISLWFVLRHGLSLQFTVSEYWAGYGWFLLSLVIHEFGHASACMRYGARPSDIGFATYWIYPVFYSDVSAAWQLKRRQRVVVDLGGAYFQAIAAAGFAIAYLLGGWAPFKVAIIMIVYSCVFMLNPILKFDGYWVVADALGVTNLARQPGRMVRHAYAGFRRKPRSPLPWSPGTTGVLAVYTVMTFGFWIYFVSRLTPLVWYHLAHYPALLSRLITTLSAPPHLPSMTLLTTLLTSTFMVLVAWLMLRRIAQPLVNPVRAIAGRWYHGEQAPNVARADSL